MKQPADLAEHREANPQLPPDPWERVAGYGVMGLMGRVYVDTSAVAAWAGR